MVLILILFTAFLYSLESQQKTRSDQRFLRLSQNHALFFPHYQFQNSKTTYFRFNQVIEYETTGTFRYSYTYNPENFMDVLLTEQFTNNQYSNLYKTTYSYDQEDRLSQYLTETWSNNQWIGYYKVIYTYGDSGDLLSIHGLSWSDNQWVDYYMNSNTYDDQHQLLSSADSYYESNAWVNYYQYNYSYNTDGTVSQYIYKTWTNNTWTNSWKADYTYSNNLLQLETWYSWSSNWVLSSRLSYTYSNDIISQYLWEYWVNNAWINSSRGTYNYNETNKPVSLLWEVWSTGAWSNSEKYNYEYDLNQNTTMQEYGVWTNNAWVYNTDVTLYVYYPYITDLYAEFYGFRITATYESLTVGNDDSPQDNRLFKLSNYPNPFNPSTTISFSIEKPGQYQLSVYNCKGQQISEQTFSFNQSGIKKQTIDLSAQSSGVYFYRVRDLSSHRSGQIGKMLLIK